MSFRKIYKLIKPYTKSVIFMSFYSIMLAFIAAAIPLVNSQLIDNGLLKLDIYRSVFFILILMLLQASDRIIQYLQEKCELETALSFGKDLKIKALNHSFRLDPQYIKDQSFYKIVGDALYDISNIINIASSNFLLILVIICKAVGAAIGLLLLDWKLALFILILIPVKIFLNIFIRKKAEKYSKLLMQRNKDYNTWFSDMLYGIIDIKLWNIHTKKINEYEEHIDKINSASKKLSLLNLKNSTVTSIMESGFVNLLYLLGAVLIIRNELTIGGLFAFVSFSSYLFIPVNAIMDMRILLKQIAPSLKSLKNFFELEEENYSSRLPLSHDIRYIEFQNVSVSYGEHAVLEKISFRMEPGSKVAIVGENGSGKTTIINLLLRLCQPSSGDIYINGTPIREYNIEDYRKHFSSVMQDVHLFNGTVLENIEISKDGFCNKSFNFCTDAIEHLDQKYETVVGSNGTKLSGGEKQKVALLRALNRKSEILILDEATANYDKVSEKKFIQFLSENDDYKYYFVITHNPEILEAVDVKIYLSNGKITKIEEKKKTLGGIRN